MARELTVLVLGNGGREHALALALRRDPSVVALHCAPGNPGTAALATNHAIDPCDGEAVVALARDVGANLVVVGPEAPLVAGVADAVRSAGIACFGPSAEAAQIEGSKQFAKMIMQAAGVPTAGSVYCTTLDDVVQAIDHFGAPYVVKQNGLAAGKGVIVTPDRDAALAHAADALPAIVEEYLDGPEVSLFAITDGVIALPLQPAQDFKRAYDGDAGPNTGGMGAYSPLPWAPEGLVDAIMSEVVQPTVDEMCRRGTPFAGLLYAGLALTSRGLKVIEFNCRFGDPETQAVLSLLETPLGVVLDAAASGRLAEVGELRWSTDSAVVVVLAANGYPGVPDKGGRIAGPHVFGCGPDGVEGDAVHVLHAGTALVDGELTASGGRVLGVVARASDLVAAREGAYDAIDALDAPTLFCRRDIAERAASGLIGTPRL